MIGLSKYQEGQEVSAYTKNDEIFEGYVKSHNGIKFAVNSNSKAINYQNSNILKELDA